MKYIILFKKPLLLVLVTVLTAYVSNAQESKEDKKKDKLAQIEMLVQSKKFDFVAQTAIPTSGRTINLTSLYNVRLSGDTLISDLPYFGRAYVAPMNPSEGGIHFTSTQFSYDIKERKKGGWDVTLLPRDTKDVRQMYLTISQEGYASLQVGSENRQNISFNGYITPVKKAR